MTSERETDPLDAWNNEASLLCHGGFDPPVGGMSVIRTGSVDAGATPGRIFVKLDLPSFVGMRFRIKRRRFKRSVHRALAPFGRKSW